MRLRRAWKVLRQLGPGPVSLYLRYRLGLLSGWYRWRTRTAPADPGGQLTFPARLPQGEALRRLLDGAERRAALREADLLLEGRFRPFSGLPAPLDLARGADPRHWTALERDHAWLKGEDIKFIWEPARFSWAFLLGRAYLLSGERRYAAAFWRLVERFDHWHPPYCGAQWMNGQEVALRLLALAWGGQLFAAEASAERRVRLRQALAAHAHRVDVTLTYARAQESNHLMSEAAALWTAGLLLPDHPRARAWLRRGRRWFLWAVARHIDPHSGEYTHHSTNYHRFILQLALWLHWLDGEAFPPEARHRLGAAARWLAGLTDPHSGDAPNWGSNDGAYIFPLAGGGFRDFRPVAQAAMRAFAAGPAFPPGPWDEMSLWFGLLPDARPPQRPVSPFALPWPQVNGRAFLRLGGGNWRLGHADLLHLDLWLEGRNLALDAGTYLYNGQPPWDNPWPQARFHNLLTVAGRDQMTRGGRFMYLDWAQTLDEQRGADRLAASTDAWRRWGLRQRRSLRVEADRLLVEDDLQPAAAGADAASRFRLHFLLADWPFQLDERGPALCLSLYLPTGRLQLTLPPGAARWSLVRGGQVLAGACQQPDLRGWYAPTYALKVPALSLAAEYALTPPVRLRTVFRFIPDASPEEPCTS